MADIDPHIIKLRRTLVIIILATIPLYLLGMVVLWVGKTASNDLTPTPSQVTAIIITATGEPSVTLAPPTSYPTPTATETFTITPTRTLIPTHTITPIPTDTATPVPTDTEAPTQAPTDTETPVPTDILPPG